MPDWPEVTHVTPSYSAYKWAVVRSFAATCGSEWRAEAERHPGSFHYPAIQGTPSTVLRECRCAGLPWPVQLGVRSWCRLRAGLICLSGQGGRCSQARFQECMFCVALTHNPSAHVLGRCAAWSQHRTQYLEKTGRALLTRPYFIAVVVLTQEVDLDAFPLAVLWAQAIDKAAEQYWRKEDI